jgi:hypothetical protein
MFSSKVDLMVSTFATIAMGQNSNTAKIDGTPRGPPVIKRGWLENPPLSSMIFSPINLHLVWGFPS